MIKKAQKTPLDDLINRDKENLEQDKQLALTRQDLTEKDLDPYTARPYRNKPIWPEEELPANIDWQERKRKQIEEAEKIKAKREPINLTYPELTPEQIKFRRLNEQENQKLLWEEKQELEHRKRYLSYQDPQHNQPPEIMKYVEIDRRNPEEIKKEIIDSYNKFRIVADRFDAAYKDANSMAMIDTSFNYSGSYIDVFKRLPDYIERAVILGIGQVFGITPNKTSYSRQGKIEGYEDSIELIRFLRRGLNLFNITPLNFEAKKKEMERAASHMESIIAEYQKRKKVLVKLPKIINEKVSADLRSKNLREFLKWLDLYFPTEKENLMKENIDQIIEAAHASNYQFNISNLRKMRTYSEIYYQAQRTAGFELRYSMEQRVRTQIIDSLKDEIIEKITPKISELSEILSSTTKEDTSVIEKFLASNFKIDLRGIFQFCNLTFKNTYSTYKGLSNYYEDKFLDFKGNFLTDLKSILKVEFGNNKKVGDILKEIVINFINQYHPSGGASDYKKLSELPGSEIENLINKYIRHIVTKSLPNFTRSNFLEAYSYPSFVGAGKLVKETGRLGVDNAVNMVISKSPYIPKEFMTALVKFAFKGAINRTNLEEEIALSPGQIFNYLPELSGPNSSIAIKTFLAILKKSNKYNPDNFTNYFRKSFKDLDFSVQFFRSNYGKFKELSDDEVVNVLSIIYRHPDYIERDKEQFEKFIQYLHNNAKDLSKKDLFSIIQNNNYLNYTKIGISRQLLNIYSIIRNLGGLKTIQEKFGSIISELQTDGFISKDFDKNIRFITSFVSSDKNINPSHPQFDKIFKLVAATESDLQTLEMSDALKKLIKDYQKKDTRLFLLDFEVNSRLRFRVLKDKDPRTLRIGIETNCCQRVGGVGEGAAKQSFANPMAGVVVLEWFDSGEWKLLTQSYFHYVPKDNGYILDNVEWNQKNCRDSEVNLEAAYALLAEKMKTSFDVKYFLAGKGYSKIESKDFKAYNLRGKDPRFFATIEGKAYSYTDFSPSNSINLLAPKFKLDKEKGTLLTGQKKALEMLADRFVKFAANIIVS